MKQNKCPEFPYFGARYPDATCIDGYLWDLDSSEDDGMLHSGGDIPCPFCNKESYMAMRVEDIAEQIIMETWDNTLDLQTIEDEDAIKIATERIEQGIKILYEKYNS